MLRQTGENRQAARPSPARDLAALVKIGIVGSNTLTALAGFALAATRAHPMRGTADGAAHLAGTASRSLPETALLLLFGSASLVAGACALNNWIDRDIDALMERTRNRPTASGRIGPRAALGVGIGLLALGLCLLALLGPVPASLGAAGAVFYLVVYSLWAKRRTALSSFIGGVAGSIPPLIGWAAVDPHLGPPAWILFALLILWQQAHVRSLALLRSGEYLRAGLPLAGLGGTSSRTGLLLWIGILLAASPSLLPFGKPVFALAALLAFAWLLLGLHGRGETVRWPWARRMFFASLVYLGGLCGALLLAGLFSP